MTYVMKITPKRMVFLVPTRFQPTRDVARGEERSATWPLVTDQEVVGVGPSYQST